MPKSMYTHILPILQLRKPDSESYSHLPEITQLGGKPSMRVTSETALVNTAPHCPGAFGIEGRTVPVPPLSKVWWPCPAFTLHHP